MFNLAIIVFVYYTAVVSALSSIKLRVIMRCSVVAH